MIMCALNYCVMSTVRSYLLVITKNANCVVNDISNFIIMHVASASLEAHIGSELTYILGGECSQAFPRLFQALDENRHVLKLQSFEVTETTLEEVFIRYYIHEYILVT